ncbi:27099_t:CDS:2 [Gigaspora margarita]|uniref:27099_t:CDS:1 n=1 Tax=Gigaspora margarita TaxID=4874 RepID=A0ABN7VTA8_GIGMA|nr:27099_t:CDS:2 [Gigaspora margarita]
MKSRLSFVLQMFNKIILLMNPNIIYAAMVATRKQDYGVGQPVSKHDEQGVSDSELPSTQRINKSVTPSTSRRRRANRKSQEKKSVTNNIRKPKTLPVNDQSTAIVPSYIPRTNERSLEDQLIENVNSQTTERPPIIEDSTDDIDDVSIISDNETRQYDDIYDLLMSKIGSMLGSNYGPKTIPPMLDVHMNLEQSIQKVDEMLRKTVPPIVERVLREKYGSIILPDKEQLNEWVMSAAHNLVQEYIKTDIRNMPDFALSSGGARIIHSLTSRPYSEMPNTKFHKMFSLLLYNGYVHGHKPHVAIDGNNQIGNCFAFSGMRGQLAIQLSRTIYITSVSYQHLDRNLALDDTNILSSPARFAVLGIPDEKYLSNSTSKALEVSQGFVRLGEFIYDLEGPPVQIFQVEHKNGSERIPIKSIIFKVNSNWGHDRYTCLYQFKVHGRNVRNVLRQHQKLPDSKTFESTPVVT